MDTISYTEAKMRGLTRYFTGTPCKHGHIAERKVANRNCLECQRLISLRRYAQLKDTAEYKATNRRRAKRWQEANPERYRDNQNRWRAINRPPNPKPPPLPKDVVRQREKAWRIANPEKVRSALKRWQERNPERAKRNQEAGRINRRARVRGAGYCPSDVIAKIRARGECNSCGQTDGPMEIDHIIPLSRGGKNEEANLQLLCRPCNRRKWAKMPHATT